MYVVMTSRSAAAGKDLSDNEFVTGSTVHPQDARGLGQRLADAGRFVGECARNNSGPPARFGLSRVIFASEFPRLSLDGS